jgi:outer membrane receptor protein involved in Fe transport
MSKLISTILLSASLVAMESAAADEQRNPSNNVNSDSEISETAVSPVAQPSDMPVGAGTSRENRLLVTATRNEKLDTDLPMSVHSVGQDTLSVDNGKHPAESLNSIAGVYVEQLAGGQGHKTAIRMPINTSGYYLYLQDNIPLQSPAFFNHNALWWSSFNSGVNRIEVLKGAGTALHGSGAVAATINILSKPVDFDGSSLMSGTFGDHGYAKVLFSTSDKVDDDSGYRVSVSHFNNDGWRDHSGSTRSEVNFRHEQELPGDASLTTLFVASDLEQEMTGPLTFEQLEQEPTNSGLSNDVLAVDPLRISKYARLSTQWDKSFGMHSVSIIPFLRYRTNDYTATWNINMPAVRSQVNTFGILALANFETSSDSTTTVGIDLEITDGEQYSFQPTEAIGRGGDIFNVGEVFYDDTTRYNGLSPYIQHTRELIDGLDLTLGARYDHADYDFDNHLTVFGDIGHGNLSLMNRSDSFHHFSPKASLNYHVDDDSSVFLRYANSFRLPTAGSLYHLKTRDSDEGIASLKPEVSDTYEIGYKANWQDLTFDFAIFYMDVDDGIVNTFNDDGQRYLVNATRVIHKGIEFATDWNLSDSININFAYSRTKHLFDQYENLSGNEQMNAPNYFANLRLQYKPKSLAGLVTMVEFQSVGDYWMDDANSERYDGFSTVNLKARYQVNDNLSINARVVNAADKEYAQSAVIRFGRSQYYPGTPQTVFVGASYQW